MSLVATMRISSAAKAGALLAFLLSSPMVNIDGVSAFSVFHLPTSGGIHRSINSPHGGPQSVAAGISTERFFYKPPPPLGNYVIPPSQPINETTTAADFLEERETNVNKIMSNVPSLTDLYSATVTIRKAMEEKENVYSQIISKLEIEQENSLKAIEAWQRHYNNTIENLQKQAEKAQKEATAKDVMHRRQIEQMEEESEGRTTSSLDKVNWLTEQLHQLKLKTHKQQLAASQAAHDQQNALLSRIDELQYKLEHQIKATEEQGEKADGYLQERMAVQAELAKVTEDYKKTVAELERQLSAERLGRAEDRRLAEEKLGKEREEAKEQIKAVQEEAEAQKTAMEGTLRTKEVEFNSSTQQLRETAQMKEAELNKNIDRMKDEVKEVKADADRRLAAEREAAMKVQDDLRVQIRGKEKELEEQISLKNIQMTKADDLMQKRLQLEHDISVLKKRFDDAVSSWDSRSKTLEAEHAKELQQAYVMLKQEREGARKQIDAALQEAEEQKLALERGLKAKDSQHSIAIREIQESSAKKGQELQGTLQATCDELQQLRFVSHENLMSEKEAAHAKQDELMAQISDKEKELADQVSLTNEQTARAEEIWSKRMELEKDLASLRDKHDSALMAWEERYNTLEAARLKEARAAETLLARKEAAARKEVEAARREVEENKAALDSGLALKDDHYKQRIRELQASAENKEKKLSANLQRISNDLQELKLESHQKIMAEKEAASKQADQLLAEIKEKEKELEGKTAETLLQSSKVDELMEKRMQLEEDLSAANNKYFSAVSEFDRMFKSLEEARVKEQQEAKELLAKTEAEANTKIEAAVEEAESHKTVLEIGLKAKDAEYIKRAEKLREESESKEKALRHNLDSVANDFQQFKFESHKKLMDEKLAFKKKENDLLAQIKDVEEELSVQSDLAVENGARADELWKKRAELAAQLYDTKVRHEGAIADWRDRYSSLEDARVRDQKAAAKAMARTEAESRLKVEAAVAKGEAHKAKLNNCLDAIASQESELQSEMERMASLFGKMQSSIANVRQMTFLECDECNAAP